MLEVEQEVGDVFEKVCSVPRSRPKIAELEMGLVAAAASFLLMKSSCLIDDVDVAS